MEVNYSTIAGIVASTSLLILAVVVCASACLSITIIVFCLYYNSITKWGVKLAASVFTSTMWAIYDTISMLVSAISFILTIPLPFNLIAILIIILVFIAGVIAFVLVGPIQAIANNLTQMGIGLGNDVAVDGRESIKEEILTIIPGYVNIFSSTVSMVTDEFVDYMCPDGVLLDCKGVTQVRFWIDMYIQYWIYTLGLIGQFFQALGIIFREFICNGKILIGGLDAYSCVFSTPLKEIPRVYLQYESSGLFRRGAINLALLVIPQSFKSMQIPVYSNRPVDLVDLDLEYQRIINRRFDEINDHGHRRNIKANLTEGGLDLSDSSEYLVYYYLETTGLLPWIQLFLFIAADIMDVFWNVIVEYVILGVLTLMIINLLFLKYTLLTITVILAVFGNLLFSLAFMLRGVIWPDIVLNNLNSTLPERNVQFVDTAMSQSISLFIMGLDPIDLLVPNNETGWLPPGSPEVREVLIDILRFVEDLIHQVLINLPHILVFIDKTLCILRHPTKCAADYQLCKMLFDDTYGILRPIIEGTSDIGNILIVIGNILIGPIFGFIWVATGILNWLGAGLDLPVWTVPAAWSSDSFKTACEAAFYQPGTFCVCSACTYNASSISSILPALEWGISSGVPCLPFSEERCCLIDSPDYKSYNVYCIVALGSTYTSIFFFFFPATFEPYTTNPQLPFRCSTWGAVLNVYDKILIYGNQNHLISARSFSLAKKTSVKSWFHMDPVHTAIGRYPFAYEMDFCTGCPLSHSEFSVDYYPLMCSDLKYQDILFAPGQKPLIHPSDGCMFYVYSLSNCYGEFWEPDGDQITATYDIENPWIHQNVICPDGAKVARAISNGYYTEMFRGVYMCTVFESWLDKIRDRYLFWLMIENIQAKSSFPNKAVWQDEWDSPLAKLEHKSMILDFVGQEELLCNITGWQDGCYDALVNMTLDFKDFKDYIDNICDVFNLHGTYSPTLFPNIWTEQMHQTSPVNKDFRNPYYNKRKGIGLKLFSKAQSDLPRYIEFCRTLIGQSELADTFINTPSIDQYYGLLTGDPRNTPIDEIVVHHLNSLSESEYPWNDAGSWPCTPSGGQNSDMYNYEHILTQQFMAIEHFMYNKELVGRVLLNWWNETIVPFTSFNATAETLCGFITELGIYWDCEETSFFLPSEFEILTDWSSKSYLPHLYRSRYHFLKLFFGDFIRNYALLGNPGEYFDLASTISSALPALQQGIQTLAISSLLQKIKAAMDNVGFGNIAQTYFSYSEDAIDGVASECIDHNLNAEFCNSVKWGLKNSASFRMCILNPYDNLPADCASEWYGQFWNFGEGAKIKSTIPTFEYARGFG